MPRTGVLRHAFNSIFEIYGIQRTSFIHRNVKQGRPLKECLKECLCSCVANTSFEGWIFKKKVWSDVGSQNRNEHVL